MTHSEKSSAILFAPPKQCNLVSKASWLQSLLLVMICTSNVIFWILHTSQLSNLLNASWLFNNYSSASWAIDSEAMRARGIIV